MITRLFAMFVVAFVLTAAPRAQERGAKPAEPARSAAPTAAPAARPPSQSPPSQSAPAPAPATPARATPAASATTLPPQLVNFRIEVAVVEEGGGQPVVRKATSLVLADRQNGSVRAMGSPPAQAEGVAQTPGRGPQRMFVDAFPMMQRDGRVQVQLTLEYGYPGSTSVRVEPLLESGKTLVVSESADPSSDRRTRVELTATILQ